MDKALAVLGDENIRAADEKLFEEFEAKLAKMEAAALDRRDDYLKAIRLVKPETADEWGPCVDYCVQHPSTAGVLEAAVKVMEALTEGKSPLEAHQSIDAMRISGFMVGDMARMVSYFHRRGEEFRVYHNERVSRRR